MFLSFAATTKFYRLRFGAVELNRYRQKGHDFFDLAYVSMHSLQNVCPHGKRMSGLCFGGMKSSKQIGQVFDIT